MKSFVLTPNGVKVRVPGFAEMMAIGAGGWNDGPLVYTRAAPVIEGKSWADPRPREQFGVAASIVRPVFEAARHPDLLSQVFVDPEWRAQLPGWEFADAADRAMLQQALGADEHGRFSPVRDGALLEGEWTAAAFTPEQLRVKVSVYHGRDTDGPVFDHFTYRVKDVAAEFGNVGAAAISVQEMMSNGVDPAIAARELLQRHPPGLCAIALAHPKGYDLGSAAAAKMLLDAGAKEPDVLDALRGEAGLGLPAAKTIEALVVHERGPRLKAEAMRQYVTSERAEMEHGEAFCRRAAQALEQLEMGAPQMGR